MLYTYGNETINFKRPIWDTSKWVTAREVPSPHQAQGTAKTENTLLANSEAFLCSRKHHNFKQFPTKVRQKWIIQGN